MSVRPGRRFVHGHNTIVHNPNNETYVKPVIRLIECACGCGQKLENRNKYGAERRYIHGHQCAIVGLLGAEVSRGRTMELSYRWKGGRRLDKDGYVRLYLPWHSRAVTGYVLEHIIVMERKIGRPLREAERVHHINEIKTDNRPENLELFCNVGEHSRMHRLKDHCKKQIDGIRRKYDKSG